MNELSIVLNGESFKLNKQVSITELFKVLDLSSKFMAVEINDEIIFRSSWDSYLINENDKVELVRAIGGG
ncbi:MAG: thiamine biosynthesis protein ThiS [Gammaproteobacteria bacterium]|jgi:sulfur carrier protein|nr:thiamine biosynthesis protein ThiS [Gammaproteobacteria bacterium]|tara:strand:- start:1050 stop:1259 length:210 start_codon:yes stop_codon:yes gene_type:complete